MSNWPQDINDMHYKFKIDEKIYDLSPQELFQFFQFRLNCLREEIQEIADAKTPEEIIDGLIDLCVFAIGTLDLFSIDSNKAWNEVHNANLEKEPGIKPERPNPFGFPDLIKPDGWKDPDHSDNTGLFKKMLEKPTESFSSGWMPLDKYFIKGGEQMIDQKIKEENIGGATVLLDLQNTPFLKGEDALKTIIECFEILNQRVNYNVGTDPDQYFPFDDISYVHQLNLKVVRMVSEIKAGTRGMGMTEHLYDLLNYGFRYASFIRKMREKSEYYQR